MILTDKYPNAKIVQQINELNIPNVKYLSESLDASKLENAPDGLKTMIASFHHMNPEIAKQILESAEKSGAPFFIYEIAQNMIPKLLWWILLPLSLAILIIMSMIMTLFVRHFQYPR